MVFEKLYTAGFLNKNKYMIFISAFAYTAVGISTSLLLFREYHQSTVSLAFISLILLVSLYGVLKRSEESFERMRSGKKTVIEIWSEYRSLLAVFSYLFAGVMFCFAVFSLALPHYAAPYVFDTQYELVGAESAAEIFQPGLFASIFTNNILVLIACLATSFLFGISTIFLFILVWNASVLGVVFGIVAKQSYFATGINPIVIFSVILLASLPHAILEILSYFVAGVSGENFSDFLFFNRSKKRVYETAIILSAVSIIIAILLLAIAAWFETTYAPFILRTLL